MDIQTKNLQYYFNYFKEDFENIKFDLSNFIESLVSDDAPIYKNKVDNVRTKNYVSLANKIEKLANKEENKKKEDILRKLLEIENSINVEDLFSEIWDIVGLRVICLFKDQIKIIVEKVIENIENHSYKIIDKRICIPKGTVIDEYWEKLDFVADERESGYTSVHLIVGLDKNHTKFKKLPGLKCEIQFRTLIEHAWAEIEHESYKKEPQNLLIGELYRVFGELLYSCDKLSNSIKKEVDFEKEKNERFPQIVPEYNYNLQIKNEDKRTIERIFKLRNNEFRKCKSIVTDSLNEVNRIRKKPRGFQDSNAILLKMINELDQEVKLKPFIPHVELEIALNYMNYKNVEGKRMAKEIYSKYLDSTDFMCRFWSNFRLSYITAYDDIELAIKYCKEAENIIFNEKLFEDFILYERNGLRTNVKCNLANFYLHAKNNYEDDPTKMNEFYEFSLNSAREGYVLTKNDNRESKVKAFALNNYVAILIEQDDNFHKIPEKELDILKNHYELGFRDTFAWFYYKKAINNTKNSSSEKITDSAMDCLTLAYEISETISLEIDNNTKLTDREKEIAKKNHKKILETYNRYIN